MVDLIRRFLDLLLHLDRHLASLAQDWGSLSYALLFAIVFAETGLVVTPILPGDSLLFAAGSLAAVGAFDVHLLAALLMVAGILGDTVNYAVGHWLGPRVFQRSDARWLKREYLDRTHAFYERHGGKTIILARFVPIIRTFAPFVAGVGAMSYTRFLVYNAVGAVLWVATFVYGGYHFGNLPWVRRNFAVVLLAIIVISVMPAVVEFARHRLLPGLRRRAAGEDPPDP